MIHTGPAGLNTSVTPKRKDKKHRGENSPPAPLPVTREQNSPAEDKAARPGSAALSCPWAEEKQSSPLPSWPLAFEGAESTPARLRRKRGLGQRSAEPASHQTVPSKRCCAVCHLFPGRFNCSAVCKSSPSPGRWVSFSSKSRENS